MPDKKISELPVGSTPTGVERVEALQGGINVSLSTSQIGGINEHFRGAYISLAALQAAVPVGVVGDYADVDTGVGNNATRYIWDVDDASWIAGSGGGVSSVTGTANQIASTGGTTPVLSLANNTALPGAPTAATAATTVNNTQIASTAFVQNRVLESYLATGTNTYAATVNGISAYAAGQSFTVIFQNVNTENATLNVNGLGAKILKKNGGSLLFNGDLATSIPYLAYYDGTDFFLSGQLFPRVFNVEDYGAKHDFQTVATASISSGTDALTTGSSVFTASDVGKSIRVFGAGAAGVDLLTTIDGFTSGTSVSLATNASTTIVTEPIEWATDDTPGLQATIDACYLGGGGTVYLPNGVYSLFGALIGTPNSQLEIPLTISAATRVTIKILGESSAQWANGPFAPQTMQRNGVVLKSQITGSGTLPSVFKSQNNSYTTIIFHTLQIITKSIEGVTHIAPTMSGIIVDQCESKQVYDVVVVTESDPTESVVPVAETYGMWLETQGKTDHQSFYSNAVASGYFYGFRVAEHTLGSRLTPICNIYGVLVSSNTFAHSVGQGSGLISNLWNRYGVGFTGGGATVDLNISTETWPGIFASRWYDYVADVFFPTSQAVNGQITFSVAAAGGAHGTPVLSGTNTGNLSIHDLKNWPTVTGDDNSITLSATGALPAEAGYVVRNTSTTGRSGFTFSNNNVANAYGSLYTTGSAASSNLFGTTQQNKVSLISDGSSSAGMLIGTVTADPIIIGTSNTQRISIGSTGIIDVTSSVTEPLRIIGSNAGSNSIYFQATNTLSQASIYMDNNRGSFASYGGQFVGGATNAAANIFGVNRQDKYFIFADGASSLGMGIGTLVAQQLILGTNNTNRVAISGTGSLNLERTVTAAGTTGAQTINKMNGTVNFAAAATTLVVTNSLATTTSTIFVQVLGVDTAAKYAVVTRASGSFTITLNAAAVAELAVAFWVLN